MGGFSCLKDVLCPGCAAPCNSLSTPNLLFRDEAFCIGKADTPPPPPTDTHVLNNPPSGPLIKPASVPAAGQTASADSRDPVGEAGSPPRAWLPRCCRVCEGTSTAGSF